MNKKAFIISLSVAFIMLVCIGITAFVIVKNGDKIASINLNYKVSKRIISDEEYDINFDKLNVITDASKIEIKNADSDKVRVVVYSNKDNLKIKKEDNLSININNMKKCKLFCINVTIPRVVIYLPNDFNNKINIENKLGDIEIDNINKVNIKNKLGDIKIDSVDNATINNDLGDIQINKVNKYLKIKENMGDVKITKINLTKDSTIYNELGDIKIGNTNEIYIDATVDLGDIKINNNYRKSDIVLKIKNDMGDIKVDN